MRRSTLRAAVALITFMVGSFAANVWGLLGNILTVEPSAPAVRQASAPECNAPGLNAEQETAKQEILEILRQYDVAQTNHEAAFFERVEAESFILTTVEGRTYNRDEAIAAMKTWPQGVRYNSDDIWVQFYGNTAIVSGRMTASYPGDGYKHSWPWLDLFVKRDGRWQIISTTQVK